MPGRARGIGRGRGNKPPIGDDKKPGGAVRVTTTQETSNTCRNEATTTLVSVSQFADVQPETTQPQEERKYTVYTYYNKGGRFRREDSMQPLLKPVKLFH